MSRFLKILVLGVLLAAVPYLYGHAGNFVRSFTSVADEAGGLGNVKCSTLGTLDGAGIVYMSTGIEYWFYDHTATDAADATHVRCKGYTTAGVWEQVKDEITPVPLGGTGAASLTNGGILLGSGTEAVTALGVATNGQIPIGDGATDPVLANITVEAGVAGVTVTNGAGSIELSVDENLEAIADAEAGVTDPCVSFYDIDAAGQAGSDKLVAKVCGQWQSGDEEAQIANLEFYAATTTAPGAPTLVGKFASATDVWDFNYPLDTVRINGNIFRKAYSVDTNLEATHPTTRRGLFFQGSTATARNFTLWYDPYEATYLSSRQISFYNNDGDQVLYLVPEADGVASGVEDDIIIIAGVDICTTTEKMSIAVAGSATVTGLSATTWLADCHGTCACVAE